MKRFIALFTSILMLTNLISCSKPLETAESEDDMGTETKLETEEKEDIILDDDFVHSVLEKVQKRYAGTSMTATVIKNGEISAKSAIGWAKKDSVPMQYDSKIWVASLSKIIVCMAAVKMQEEGIIALDDEISKYWGCEIKNPNNATPVTIRHLMTHTSSLNSLGTINGKDEIKNKLYDPNNWQNTVPGTQAAWLYNNSGYDILGATLDLALNGSLDTYLKAKFFEPLGMDSSFDASTLKEKEKVADMYDDKGKIQRSADDQLAQVHSLEPCVNSGHYHGGIISSSFDLAKIYRVLMLGGTVDGVRYLTPESVDLIKTEFCKVDKRTTQSQCVGGIRMQEKPFKNIEKVYFHTGSGLGVHNLFIYDPDTNNGIVIFTLGAPDTLDTYGFSMITSSIAKEIFSALNK